MRLMLFLTMIAGWEVHAQVEVPSVLSLSAFAKPDTVKAGDSFILGVTLLIEDGWHINSNAPLEEFLIPTEVSWELPAGFDGGASLYPKDKRLSFSFSGKKLSVFDRKVHISVKVAVPDTAGGLFPLKGWVRYQACNDEVCLPPKNEPVETTIYVVDNP